MALAVADLEALRRAIGAEQWIVLGHSWGSDLAVRYALDHPDHVRGVVGIAGHGLHRDQEWSAAYEAGNARQIPMPIEWVPEVYSALRASFTEWIHEPELWRQLADSPVPMTFIAPGDDFRPTWPLQQLAALVPRGAFEVVPGTGHDFWSTDPPPVARRVHGRLFGLEVGGLGSARRTVDSGRAELTGLARRM